MKIRFDESVSPEDFSRIVEELAAEADQLIIDFLQGAASRQFGHERWTCPRCGERLEGQFTDCWQCGSPRPPPACARMCLTDS